MAHSERGTFRTWRPSERDTSERATSERGTSERDTSERDTSERGTSERGTSKRIAHLNLERGTYERDAFGRGTSGRGTSVRGTSKRGTSRMWHIPRFSQTPPRLHVILFTFYLHTARCVCNFMCYRIFAGCILSCRRVGCAPV